MTKEGMAADPFCIYKIGFATISLTLSFYGLLFQNSRDMLNPQNSRI